MKTLPLLEDFRRPDLVPIPLDVALLNILGPKIGQRAIECLDATAPSKGHVSCSKRTVGVKEHIQHELAYIMERDFHWASTPEGYTYWSNIRSKLRAKQY